MNDIPQAQDADALPVTFRQQLIGDLVSRWRAGESCSLIGVGSSGKSNVARHPMRADVRQLHFGALAAQTVYLYVNCDALTGEAEPYSGHALYALMLETLGQTLKELGGALGALGVQADGWWQAAVKERNEALTRHHLKQTLAAVVANDQRRVVMVLDDCDKLITNAVPALLRGLRALRDDFKPKLVYATVTRRELNDLHSNSPEFEAFFELLSAHILFVPPYTESEALGMLARLAARREGGARALPEVVGKRLYGVTGGHAGLLKAAYFATKCGEHALASNLVAVLNDQAIIGDECAKILDSLDEDAKADLLALAHRQTATQGALTRLRKMGLVTDDFAGLPQIFSPLLRDYLLAENAPPPAASTAPLIVPNPSSHQVTIASKIVQLSPVEFAIFMALYTNRPKTVSRSDLATRALALGNDPAYPHGKGPTRLVDECLDNLRAKINVSGRTLFIATPDGGFRFSEAGQ